jgi:hypothetical protein
MKLSKLKKACDGHKGDPDIMLKVLDEGTDIDQMRFVGVKLDKQANKLYILLETIETEEEEEEE